MAWVKMKNRNGFVLDVPESVYESMFKGNGAYSLLEEPKPSPNKIEEKNKVEEKEIVKDDLRKYNTNETISARKGTKKII